MREKEGCNTTIKEKSEEQRGEKECAVCEKACNTKIIERRCNEEGWEKREEVGCNTYQREKVA